MFFAVVRTWRSWLAGVGGGLLVAVWVALPVCAQGNSSIAQNFRTTDLGITPAALVGTKKDNPNTIELSSLGKAANLVGVVANKPLVELSGSGSGAQVVTSGTTATLVSDLNGDVSTGDKITVSPIEGVGMKATESTTIIGTAQGDLESAATEVRTITDSGGKQRAVKIGVLAVQIDIAYYSVPTKTSAFVPGFLQELANSIAGQAVSPVRVLLAGLIVLLLFISITALLYSAVRSSIISIGRNPLSERAVRKSLMQVSLGVLLVLTCSILIIYLVLTL